jgi:hypothetical protein
MPDMDFKNASLGELQAYWEHQRLTAEEKQEYWRRKRFTAEEKLRHLDALLGDEGEATGTSEPRTEEAALPPLTPSLTPTAPAQVADTTDSGSGTDTLMGRTFALLPKFIDAQSGTFTRREMMNYLEENGLQLTRQVMHHAVYALKKKGVLIEHEAAPGGASKYLYTKSAISA